VEVVDPVVQMVQMVQADRVHLHLEQAEVVDPVVLVVQADQAHLLLDQVDPVVVVV
jgi:hypothetical protein